MNKSILVGLAILTLSTSAASAWTHRIHHSRAMNPNSRAVAMNPTPYAGPRNAYAAMGAPRTNAYVSAGPYYAPPANAYAAAGPNYASPPHAYGAVGPYARPRNAYVAMGAPPTVMPGVSSKNHEMYMKNLRDSGYDPKNDFTKAGTMAQH